MNARTSLLLLGIVVLLLAATACFSGARAGTPVPGSGPVVQNGAPLGSDPLGTIAGPAPRPRDQSRGTVRDDDFELWSRLVATTLLVLLTLSR
jgi:hypothetical protein